MAFFYKLRSADNTVLKRDGGFHSQGAAKEAAREDAKKMKNMLQPDRPDVGALMVGQNTEKVGGYPFGDGFEVAGAAPLWSKGARLRLDNHQAKSGAGRSHHGLCGGHGECRGQQRRGIHGDQRGVFLPGQPPRQFANKKKP